MNRQFPLVFVVATSLILPVAANSAEHLGSPATAKNADRTVVLKPNAAYVSIERGEIVTLVYMDKSFTWKFDTVGTPNFALAEIAPKDFGTGHVRVYVAPNLQELGG